MATDVRRTASPRTKKRAKAAKYDQALIIDRELVDEMITKRGRIGADRHDEVWDGVYVMSPLAGDEHQRLVARLNTILDLVIGMNGLGEVRPGANVSDRARGWQRNYRVPDVVVRLNGGVARILKTHWHGGPDFLIEVASTGDRSREKLEFYASIGTREALIVDNALRSLELYALHEGRMEAQGVSRRTSQSVLQSDVVGLTFQLLESDGRARIEVTHPASGQRWLI